MRIILLFMSIVILTACGKDSNTGPQEHLLYGTWAQGPGFRDTIWFYQQADKSIMRTGMFSNWPVYDTVEYTFSNNIVTRKRDLNGAPHESGFKVIWQNYPIEFSIEGPEIYYLSTTVVGPPYIYKKVR